MTKDELQGIAARRLMNSRRLVCQWATGVGKSNVALRFLEDHPSLNCLILVPEDDNIKNWKAEFQKFNVPDDNVTIACYASLHKFLHTGWGLIVLDDVVLLAQGLRYLLGEVHAGLEEDHGRGRQGGLRGDAGI